MTMTAIEHSDLYKAFADHTRSFRQSGTSEDADKVLLDGVDLIRAMMDSGCVVHECLESYVDLLHAIGRKTWWCCACGAISPVMGEVDAYCEKCGTWRHLPARLSFPVWTAWVMVSRLRWPETWFMSLRRWAEEQNLLVCEAVEEQSLSGRCGGRHDRPDSASLPLAAPAEGDAAYADADASGKDAPGETSPAPCLCFIDGMRIYSDGKVCGSQWIALPLPPASAMRA